MSSGASRALDALIRLSSDGWPVSVREVQRDLGYKSPDSAHILLVQLKARGLAEQHPRNQRGGWKPVKGAKSDLRTIRP